MFIFIPMRPSLFSSYPFSSLFSIFKKAQALRSASFIPCLAFLSIFLAQGSSLVASTISLESLSLLKDSSGNELNNGLVLVGSFLSRPDTGVGGISSFFSSDLATTQASLSDTGKFSVFADGLVNQGGLQFVGKDYTANPNSPVTTTGAFVDFVRSDSVATTLQNQDLFVLIFNQSSIGTSTEMMMFRPFLDSQTGLRPGIPEGDQGSYVFSLEAPNISALFPELFFGTWADDGSPNAAGQGSLFTSALNKEFGITSTLSTTATNGSSFSYQITANNGPLTFEASNLPAGLSINATSGVISGIPNDTPGIYTVVLRSLGGTVTSTKSLSLTLTAPAGTPPVIVTTPSIVQLFAGVPYTNAYAINASNAATNPPIISYGASNLPTGLSVHTNTGIIYGTPTQLVTNRSVTIFANNGSVGSGQFQLTIAPPSVTYLPLTFTAGTASSSPVPVVTSGYSPTNYSANNLPNGLTIGSGGVIQGTPTVGGTATTSTITALDSNGVSSSSDLLITVNSLPPTINSANVYTIFNRSNATPYAITTVLTSTVVAPTRFFVSRGALPLGLSLNLTSGVISGTPLSGKGITTVGLKANNANTNGVAVPGGANGPEFDLSIRVDLNPPVFNQVLRKNCAAGFPLNANNNVLSATNDPESFSFTGAPSWLSIANDGKISGTPPTAGTWTIPVTIANTTLAGVRQSATSNVVITVSSGAPTAGSLGIRPGTFILNENLAVTYPPDGFFVAGRDLGSDASTSINILGLPPGVGFASLDDRRRGLLTGTPTRIGTYPCTVYTRNAKGFTRSSMTFEVR